jgi:hypothetical protein
MADTLFSKDAAPIIPNNYTSAAQKLLDEYEQILSQHRVNNPDLYRILALKKLNTTTKDRSEIVTATEAKSSHSVTAINKNNFLPDRPLRGKELRSRIRESHREIHQRVAVMNAEIIPHTKAHNRKSSCGTIEEERDFRSEIVGAQIRTWRSLLPGLITKLSRISDPRRSKSVKHKLTMLMIFGLFGFIFRLSSRREMNRELTGALIHENLRKLFPEIETIPHADTLARLLEKINPQKIEAAHINLIKELINKKKFKNLLIHGCLPVTIDGTQKLYRDGLLQDRQWCERKVGNSKTAHIQQYIYVIEANITLKNGLTIPLLTEYLHCENNELMQPIGKQDSETTAFERMVPRLKKYFPRQKMIFFLDAMYATQTIMGMLHKNNVEYLIKLPKKKLVDLAKYLNKNKPMCVSIPGQPAYRKRKQEFYWENNIPYGHEWQLTINLIGCMEQYDEVNNKTGELVKRYSEHTWISSVSLDIDIVHELCNLGARKMWLIEDSINTEKNRGYHYKHAFSYNWNAMKGFHYLMRLAHAINAISEFTKKLKYYIKELGCSATLKIM